MANDSDGKTVDNGTAEQPNSESSTGQGQQSSQPDYITKKEFTKLQEQITALNRSLQSGKDKAIAETNKRINVLEGDIREVLQSALSKGQNISDVLSELDVSEESRIRQETLELLRTLKEGRLPGASSVGSEQNDGVDVAGVLQEYGFDLNDMRVKEFQSRKFSSEADLYKQALQLQSKINSRQPSDADKPADETARKSAPTNQDKLKEEYAERSKGVYGQALINLQREMRRKGLTI